ncbi:MAG: hypothetical protein D6785_02760 [Planctomycetota bacterium]|nr:MAG: hypothetical protein D6785_02760 [Planctomycetota bacterium]
MWWLIFGDLQIPTTLPGLGAGKEQPQGGGGGDPDPVQTTGASTLLSLEIMNPRTTFGIPLQIRQAKPRLPASRFDFKPQMFPEQREAGPRATPLMWTTDLL